MTGHTEGRNRNASLRLLYATTCTDFATFTRGFAESIKDHGGNPRTVMDVSMDLSPAFQKGDDEHLPSVQVTVDHFHLMKPVDAVRRGEVHFQVIVHVPAYHLYLDATSGPAPAGTIPLPEANHPVIFVGAHSEIARTPGGAPEASGMTGMETVTLAKGGRLKADEPLHLTGYRAWFWKDLLAWIPTSEYGSVSHHVMAQSVHLTTSPTQFL